MSYGPRVITCWILLLVLAMGTPVRAEEGCLYRAIEENLAGLRSSNSEKLWSTVLDSGENGSFTISAKREGDRTWVNISDKDKPLRRTKILLSNLINRDFPEDELFKLLPPNFKLHQRYRVQIKDSPYIHSLEYIGERESKNDIIYLFRNSEGLEKVIEVSGQDLAAAKEMGRSHHNLAANLLNLILGSVAIVDDVARTMFAPYLKLASTDHVKVMGGPWASRKLANEIAETLNKIDSRMEKMGFRAPKIRVVLRDKVILPNIVGPHMLHMRTIALFDPKKKTTMMMTPILRDTSVLKDPTVSAHERAHSIFHSTYSNYAFVNKNSSLQEGLADYVSADTYDTPVIGKKAVFGKDIRDLKTKQSGGDTINSLLDVNWDIHENGLFYANTLWRLRQKIGPEKMEQLFKPILDDLNSHHFSYTGIDGLVRHFVIGDSNADATVIENYEYFLASLLKTGNESGIGKEVKSVVHDAAIDLHLSPEKIETVSSKLERYPNANQHPPGPGDNGTLVWVTAAGVAGGAGAAALSYWIVTPDSKE